MDNMPHGQVFDTVLQPGFGVASELVGVLCLQDLPLDPQRRFCIRVTVFDLFLELVVLFLDVPIPFVDLLELQPGGFRELFQLCLRGLALWKFEAPLKLIDLVPALAGSLNTDEAGSILLTFCLWFGRPQGCELENEVFLFLLIHLFLGGMFTRLMRWRILSPWSGARDPFGHQAHRLHLDQPFGICELFRGRLVGEVYVEIRVVNLRIFCFLKHFVCSLFLFMWYFIAINFNSWFLAFIQLMLSNQVGSNFGFNQHFFKII